MTKLHSTLNSQIQVQDERGNKRTIDATSITRLIASLTDDPQAIMRATDLIMRQLSLYPIIKEFNLKCLIFKTLKQLSYGNMADQYYRQFLAKEV